MKQDFLHTHTVIIFSFSLAYQEPFARKWRSLQDVRVTRGADVSDQFVGLNTSKDLAERERENDFLKEFHFFFLVKEMA